MHRIKIKASFAKSLLALILLVSFLSAGCSEGPGASSEVVVGAVLPLTGPVASYGNFAREGIDLAVEEINADGGIGGQPLRVDYQDDRGETKEAVTIMNRFTGVSKYPVVVGAAASSTSVALAPLASRSKVVLISPISSAATLTTNGGDYFFRVCPSDAFQARILAEWMLSRELKRAAVMFINNSWGASLKDAFVEHYRDLGGETTVIESALEGARSFRTQIAKMKASNAQAFFVPTYGKEGGAFVRQARELGVQAELFGGDVWGSPEFLETAGNAAEGCHFTKPEDPSGEKFAQFAARFQEKYGKAPEVYASYSYDLVQIVAKALRAGNSDGPSIQRYLRDMVLHEGVTGSTKFDEHNDVTTKSFGKWVIRGGVAKPAQR